VVADGSVTAGDQVLAAVGRYVILPSEHAAVAVVLWIAASHAVPAWNTEPRLVINAPEKGCGSPACST
jgi:hypothetical protein